MATIKDKRPLADALVVPGGQGYPAAKLKHDEVSRFNRIQRSGVIVGGRSNSGASPGVGTNDKPNRRPPGSRPSLSAEERDRLNLHPL